MITAILLSIIQGIAEFLPISSSAHLIIFREIFENVGLNFRDVNELTFDLAVHFGTLLAILIFFFKDLLNIFLKGITKGVKDENGKLMYLILVASIPAAIIGILIKDKIEVIRENILVIIIALSVMGIIIYFADKLSKRKKTIKKITFKNAFLVGCAQIFALIPGFSRSGTTISALRLMEVEREDSAKFSFYMAIPVIGGAILLDLISPGTLTEITNNLDLFIVSVLVSLVTGLICIKYLLLYLKKHSFKVFMYYRIILSIITFAIFFL